MKEAASGVSFFFLTMPRFYEGAQKNGGAFLFIFFIIKKKKIFFFFRQNLFFSKKKKLIVYQWRLAYEQMLTKTFCSRS